MKNISKYIKESIDTDNLFWKIDKWFYNRDDEKQAFAEFVNTFKGKTAAVADIEKYLGDTGKNPKPFIDFLNDEVIDNTSKDYLYILSKVINTINANKSKTI